MIFRKFSGVQKTAPLHSALFLHSGLTGNFYQHDFTKDNLDIKQVLQPKQ